jgi:hypothetical protein
MLMLLNVSNKQKRQIVGGLLPSVLEHSPLNEVIFFNPRQVGISEYTFSTVYYFRTN